MSGRTKKFAVVILVMSLLLVGVVGAAQAQTPEPANPDATPNRLQQMQERLGPEAYGQMIQRMTERHGAEAAGQILQRMASGEDCDGSGHGGMMSHRGMMGRADGATGWFGGMINGLQRGTGRMMGSWH